MKCLKMAVILAAAALLGGCVLTKVVTVPMRVTGAVISVIPVVGSGADAAIDTAADAVDKIPL